MSDSLTDAQRRRVLERSRGLCEALVQIYGHRRGPKGPLDKPVWTRCFDRAGEIHHLLTRGRGGGALDQAGEIYHLAHLCTSHHRMADGAAAYAGNLLIEGQAAWDALLGRPVYTGPDPYLAKTYPAVAR